MAIPSKLVCDCIMSGYEVDRPEGVAGFTIKLVSTGRIGDGVKAMSRKKLEKTLKHMLGEFLSVTIDVSLTLLDKE